MKHFAHSGFTQFIMIILWTGFFPTFHAQANDDLRENFSKQLWQAACEGRYEDVHAFLHLDPQFIDLNYVGYSQKFSSKAGERINALDCAIYAQDQKLIDLILANGPRFNFDINSSAPIKVAIASDNIEALKKLLTLPEIRKNYYALAYAAQYSKFEAFQILIEVGAYDLNASLNEDGMSAAMMTPSIEIFSYIVGSNNFSPNLLDAKNRSILHHLGYQGRRAEFFEQLLQHPNIDVSVIDDLGNTVLQSYLGNMKQAWDYTISPQIFMQIVSLGVDLNVRDSHNALPHCAIAKQLFDKYLYVLDVFVPLEKNNPCGDGQSLFFYLGNYLDGKHPNHEKRATNIFRYLLEKKLGLHFVDTLQRTVLYNLATSSIDEKNWQKWFEEITRLGVDLNVQDQDGNALLSQMLLDPKLHRRVFYLLTNAEPNIDLQNVEGQTPLMIAAEQSLRKELQFLLLKNADYHLTDILQRTALDYASNNDVRTDILGVMNESAYVKPADGAYVAQNEHFHGAIFDNGYDKRSKSRTYRVHVRSFAPWVENRRVFVDFIDEWRLDFSKNLSKPDLSIVRVKYPRNADILDPKDLRIDHSHISGYWEADYVGINPPLPTPIDNMELRLFRMERDKSPSYIILEIGDYYYGGQTMAAFGYPYVFHSPSNGKFNMFLQVPRT